MATTAIEAMAMLPTPMDGRSMLEGTGRISPTTIPGRTITLSAIQAALAAGMWVASEVATAAALAGGIWEAVAMAAAAIDERNAGALNEIVFLSDSYH
jgi:hypothetical protein